MRNVIPSLVLLSVVLAVGSAHAAEPKADPKSDATIGETRTQKLKAFTFYYGSTRANFENLAEKLKVLIPQLHKSVIDAHALANGPMIMIYHGVTGDPKTEFDLEVGFPIAEKVKGAGDFKVRDVEEYSCVSLLFSGPLSKVGSAYEKLMPAVMGGTGKPTGEIREMYLYFEATESPNNVVHISGGVKYLCSSRYRHRP